MKNTTLTTLLLSFCCACLLHAQDPIRYYSKTLDIKDGLSQNTVNAILQDGHGFMWFGTKDGLNRYDGLSFRIFKKEESGPGNNFITPLYEDADGNIWIGTDAGVYIYDPLAETFACFDQPAHTGESITRTVTMIGGDARRGIWISVDYQGLFHYDPARRQLSQILQKGPDGNPLANVTRFWFEGDTCWLSLYDDNLYHTGDAFDTLVPFREADGKEPFKDDIVNTQLAGEWTKYPTNPLLQKPGGLAGRVHSALFTDQTPRLKSRPAEMYANPVVDYSLPDPSVIRGDDGYYYLYATEDIRNLPIHRSKDLVRWEFAGTAFTDRSRPDFEPEGGIWAPDIQKIDGRYVLYYSMSVWGGEWTCGIGCAVADTPAGPFTDRGLLLRSNEIGVQNSIDPFYIEDEGQAYLFWGSFRGIYGIELTADGLSIRPGAQPRQVAGTAYEGTYIHKKDGYYYLFASAGTCCEGLKSTYTTVVGRSKHLFGPYVNKKGEPMMENRHEILIHKNDAFVGTGHNSEIVTDREGNDWMFYHAVSVEHPEGRVLMLDRIRWQDGWPWVETGSPSLQANKPKV